jgi:putative DNA primase/helicase
MHTAQDGEPAGSLSYETDPLVRIDLTTYTRLARSTSSDRRVIAMDLHEIARQLSHVKWRDDTFMARCPAHEDRTPSLSGKAGDDGRVLLHCLAGCRTADVLSEIGLSFRDLYPTPLTVTTPTLRSSPSTPTTYDYRDVDGTFLTQIVRWADKSFYSQSKPDGEHWIKKAADKRVPYRLPDLVSVHGLDCRG